MVCYFVLCLYNHEGNLINVDKEYRKKKVNYLLSFSPLTLKKGAI